MEDISADSSATSNLQHIRILTEQAAKRLTEEAAERFQKKQDEQKDE
jgi:hypothetical protein